MEFINEESGFFNGMVRNNNERLHGSGFLNVVSLILSQSTVTLSIAIAIDKVTVLRDKMRDMTDRQAWAEELLLSTVVISNSKGPSKTVRDIRTSTYQICSIEEKTI